MKVKASPKQNNTNRNMKMEKEGEWQCKPRETHEF
jgi:hypothetical protein